MGLKIEGNLMILRLEEGEDYFQGIKKAFLDNGLKGGFLVSGVGMIKDPKIGFYEKEKGYVFREMAGEFEIVNLSGNITSYNDDLRVHMHISLGDRDSRLYGGHLEKGQVWATSELCFILTKEPLIRVDMLEGPPLIMP